MSPEKTVKKISKEKSCQSFLTKHFNKIYPFVLHRTNSLSSISISSSLSLSRNSNGSFSDSYRNELGNVMISTRTVTPMKNLYRNTLVMENGQLSELRRCDWVTKSSGNIFQLGFFFVLKIIFNTDVDFFFLGWKQMKFMLSSMMRYGEFRFMKTGKNLKKPRIFLGIFRDFL